MAAPQQVSKGLREVSVLVVEDDEDIRGMTVSVLEGAGASVETASSANEAMAKVASTPFDAVLLDWHLADMTGSSLLLSLRDGHPALFTHTAVVTGDVLSMPGQHDAERLGRPVLAKPFRPKQLIAAVLDLLS